MMTAEFTNFTDPDGNEMIPQTCKGFSDWLKQTYFSFGSLLAKSCQSAMRLAGHSDYLKNMAFAFGENVSYAEQVVCIYFLFIALVLFIIFLTLL